MILWILLIILIVWMALRFLPAGMDSYTPLPQLIALIPYVSVLLIVVGGISLSTKNFAQLWVSVFLLIVELLWSLTFYIPMPQAITAILGSPQQDMQSSISTGTSGTTPRITVMTINSRYGHADTSALLHEIKQLNVDVLAAQEVSDTFVSHMHDSGITNVLGYEQLGEKTNHDNAGFNALWSRYPVTNQAGTLLNETGSNTPWIQLNVNGHDVRIVSVHPYSPQRSTSQWHHDINSLSTLATDSASPTIIMGDMNSSTFHPTLRSVINSGLIDTSLELHRGPHTTFPASWPLVPSMIEIDHILHTRELRAVSMSTIHIPRTDHTALVATLEWK